MKITFREPSHGFPERVKEPWHSFQLCNDLYFHPAMHYFAAKIALHYNYHYFTITAAG
jgi:hypothetical protein